MTLPNRTERIDRRSFLRIGALVAGGVLVTGTGSATSAATTTAFHEGESIAVGDGTVTAYATTTPKATVESLGVHVDGAAMDAFDDEEVKAPLAFPAQTAAGNALDHHQFRFVRFEYLPEGHIPKGVYDVPHFDFHFFMLDESIVETIERGPARYSIPEAQMPEDHIRPPLVDTDDDGEPDAPLVESKRGEPITDPGFTEYQEDGEFTHTHLYGGYDPDGDGEGRLILFEPMLTTDFVDQLDTLLDVNMQIPTAYFTGDEYPTSYVIQPVSDGGIYVCLTDFEGFPSPGTVQ
ncbi:MULTISPECIES: hypothetical protein [Halorussus]|uniref:hypothetical protein n=1 Tax=Halorussus TaxID=1070314 RepID=UPI000E21605C|nr:MULTISPECIES: hypothetical protein [Halorussus]NHN61573.1 hypothetical protein [Halorussus sp. JP-T4]